MLGASYKFSDYVIVWL